MAKANLHKLDEQAGREAYGKVLRRAVELAGLIDKDAADQLGVDRAQFCRWLAGSENAQCWRFHQHAKLSVALIQAEAERTPRTRVRIHIEIDREEAAS